MKRFLFVAVLVCVSLLGLACNSKPTAQAPPTKASVEMSVEAIRAKNIADFILKNRNSKKFDSYKTDVIGDNVQWRAVRFKIGEDAYTVYVSQGVDISMFVENNKTGFRYIGDSGIDGTVNTGTAHGKDTDFFDEVTVNGRKIYGAEYRDRWQKQYAAELETICNNFGLTSA
jgi:hypothetical protein